LPLNEKWIYEEEARKGKEEDKFDLENKYTTQGKSYAQVEREKNEAVDQLNKMNHEIESTVRSLDYWTCEFETQLWLPVFILHNILLMFFI
jgi:thymidylate synthase